MKNIQAVLFDFGGVFTVSPFSAFDEIGQSLGIAPGKTHELLFGAYHHDGDHPWHRLERGEISLEDARQAIMASSRQQGVELDIYQILAGIPRDGGIRQPLVDKVAELKQQGYRRAIITNNVKEFADGWRSLLPVDELFELVVDSCVEGVRKPDPAIFDLALSRMGIAPEQAVFLDDYPTNVTVAADLGMQTILVGEDIQEAIRELDALLGLPDAVASA